MHRVTTERRPTSNPSNEGDGSRSRGAASFAPGSLEAELSAIGTSVPARAWAKVPADYFANLDHYRHGAPKRK
jgi:hypothetical protein